MAHPSRRAVLGAGIAVAAAGAGVALGFERSIPRKVAVAPPSPPAALTAALSAHRQLIAMCDGALAADPDASAKVTPLRRDLAAHVDALQAVLETYPGWRYEQSLASSAAAASGAVSASSPAPSAAPTVALVSAAVQRQSSQLTAVCLGWPSTADGATSTVVPLLGSVCACLAVHVELLA